MEREKFFVSASPHIHEGSSTQGLMIHVLIALMPVVVASGMIFGARAWLVVAVCAVSCVVFEALLFYCSASLHKRELVGAKPLHLATQDRSVA